MDFSKTFATLLGALTNPEATWASYQTDLPEWKQTLIQVYVPLVVTCAIAGYILSLIFRSSFLLLGSPGIRSILLGLVLGIILFLICGWIIAWLAGTFKGRNDLNASVAAITLTAVPAYVGGVLGYLPFIGWLLSLGASIYSLVLLYRIIPGYLGVPEDTRVKHYVASLAACLVVAMMLSLTFSGWMVSEELARGADSWPAESEESASLPAFTGAMQRTADFYEAAMNDTYEPPEDGKLTEDQVQAYIDSKSKTAELRARLADESPEFEGDSGDLSDLMGGVNTMMRSGNAEIEVVKSAGRNWAEHQWIGNQIETARIQKDLNETTGHNYQLFEKYRAELQGL